MRIETANVEALDTPDGYFLGPKVGQRVGSHDVGAITSDYDVLRLVGRAGIEPATYGLKGLVGPEDLRGVNPDRILRGSFVRRVLRLAARHDLAEAGELHLAMRQLAVVVLAADEVRLAREVLEGGRFAIVKAVELAERLLAAEAAYRQHFVAAGNVQ